MTDRGTARERKREREREGNKKRKTGREIEQYKWREIERVSEK